jgi:L,D-peptidoglycan transpeptidase YkuD (ErfK/YbiS/YcfS/YnhG family)
MSSSSRHSRHSRPPARSTPDGRRGIGWLLLGFGAVLSLLAVAIVLVTMGGSAHDRDRGASVGVGVGEASQPLPTLTHGRSASRPPLSSSPTGSPSASSNANGSRAAQSVPTRPTPAPQPAGSPAGGPVNGLPLQAFTGSASQVITVLAASGSSTTAIVEAWSRQGAGWVRYGASVSGYLGSAGLTSQPSEQTPATPIGSYTLTQAFGAEPNPDTALPYLKTTPGDWWISQPGPLYNTHQRCVSHCPFVQAAPNQHLRDLTPAYDYAAVIDYNTADAGPVRQGAGSAFFLDVSNGHATAGSVSIPEERLIALLRWLKPTAHPRILIGIGGS